MPPSSDDDSVLKAEQGKADLPIVAVAIVPFSVSVVSNYSQTCNQLLLARSLSLFLALGIVADIFLDFPTSKPCFPAAYLGWLPLIMPSVGRSMINPNSCTTAPVLNI